MSKYFDLILVLSVIIGIIFGSVIIKKIMTNIKEKKTEDRLRDTNYKILRLIVNTILDGQIVNEDTIETFINSYSRESMIQKKYLLENYEYLEDAIVVIYSMEDLDISLKEEAAEKLSVLRKELKYSY